MPKLQSIMKPMETLTVSFGTETLTVKYRPQYLTPEFEDKLKSLESDKEATSAFVELFCGIVAGWDLTNDEEQPIPITPEALKSVPYEILGNVMEKVQEAVVPNSKTEQNSEGTSPLAVGSVPSLTGTE